MHKVRPKKFLGQHFLKDHNIAQKIVDSLSEADKNESIIEIGPGTGVLTDMLVNKNCRQLLLFELDRDSIAYLRQKILDKHVQIIEGDFLKIDIESLTNDQLLVIGNFPYNISSQIFFKLLNIRHQVKEVVCMIQKEVADRICSPHGNKTYGILSVLIGAYYYAEMLFKVAPGVFVPPPKVNSAVIRLTRKAGKSLGCDEELFKRIVKQGFQNRRKTLRNALKPIFLPVELTKDKVFDKRAEQLSIEDFIDLTNTIEQWKK
jgi:16S rRNA (adenine1518-N6/adenine1519-N6)-dimethyltransferase